MMHGSINIRFIRNVILQAHPVYKWANSNINVWKPIDLTAVSVSFRHVTPTSCTD